MYRTVTRNLRKRKKIAGTWFLETTTMFDPSQDSMAQKSFEEADALREGRKKRGRHRIMYDHRWGECQDVSDELALRLALREAYGDAMLWIDLDSLVDEFYDLRNEESDSIRYFLNDKVSASDAYIKVADWKACKRSDKALQKGDLVALGLDGSVRDDATAIVACRLDGHIELLGLWENPGGVEGLTWQVDREAVDAAVAAAMKRFEVAAFYCDPPHWQDYVDRWNNEYGEKMQVKANVRRPLEWWTNKAVPMAAALERFEEAVIEQRITYTAAEDRPEGSEEHRLTLALTRHVGNAHRRMKRAGLAIAKDTPKSERKIDGCMAAVLAYQAAQDCRAAGVKPKIEQFQLPKRIR